MIHIKRFIDKVAYTEGKQSKDLVMPLLEARGLRDELSKMLADNIQLMSGQNKAVDSKLSVEIVGGKF